MLVIAGWSWIDGQTRAVVVVSSVLEAPVLTPAIEVVTEEPVVEDTVFAGRPALVAKPDLPGLTTDEITEETVSSTVEVAQAVADRPDAESGRIGLIGVSTGATLALLVAEDEEVRDRVSVVAGVAPYTDIQTVLNIATTGHYW